MKSSSHPPSSVTAGQAGDEICVRRVAEHQRRVACATQHLERIGVKLTKLTKKQADYLGVPVEGPYKPEY